MLVLIGDFNLVTPGFEFDTDSFAKTLVISCKGQLKSVGNVVIPALVSLFLVRAYALYSQHPLQIAMKVGIHTLHILQRDLLP